GKQGRSTLAFLAERPFKELPRPEEIEVEWFHGEQSNSSTMLGSHAIIKLIRRTVAGVHPEAEMTRYLTRAGYKNSAGLLAELVRRDEDGTPHTLALVHERVANQGDAWTWTQEYLSRTLQSAALTGETEEDYQEELRGYTTVAGVIGRRLAQLHQVLAAAKGDPDFEPEAATKEDAQAWARDIREMFQQAIKAATAQRDRLPEPARNALQEIQA